MSILEKLKRPGNKHRPVKILSIDGGGIRGIIPSLVLAEIEKRTAKSTSELFDLVAGTSTGGLLALALTKPGKDGKPEYSANDVAVMYEEQGGKIFSRTLWHTIHAVGNLAEVKYTPEGIDEVLDNCFGDARLSDALTETLIAAYEIERQQPYVFKSWRADEDSARDFLMRDVARATSAAPMFFEPVKVEVEDIHKYYAFVDGLVFASNPTACAYVEALKRYENSADLLVVSLGTGEAPHRKIYDEVRTWGAVQWIQPLLEVVLHGSVATVDYQMRQLLPPKSGEPRYFRLQAKLDKKQATMDNVTPANLRTLRLLAEDLVKEKSELLDDLVKRLLA